MNRRRIGIGLLILIGLLVVAAIIFIIYSGDADRRAIKNNPPPGELIALGDRNIHIYCLGEENDSQPTIVIVPGLDDSSANWQLVQPDLAEDAHVCAYDRAGTLWSDLGPMPRTGSATADDLHDALAAMGIGDVVLVGYSASSLTILPYVTHYPDDVQGIVLVNPIAPQAPPESLGYDPEEETSNSLMRSLIPLGVHRLMGSRPGIYLNEDGSTLSSDYTQSASAIAQTGDALRGYLDEVEGYPASFRELGDTQTPPDVPVFMLTSSGIIEHLREDLPEDMNEEQQQQMDDYFAWLETIFAWHRTYAEATPNGQLIEIPIEDIANTYIPINQPQTIIDAVREMLALIQADA